MIVTFTILDPDTDEVVWILHYNPALEVPFSTKFGTHYVWNWDFITGALLKEGEPLVGYAVILTPGASSV